MTLPIARILWAGNNASHHDHLHVEGEPTYVGWTTGYGAQPPSYNPGQTDPVKAIYEAMTAGFGTGYYFQDTPPAEPRWAHMGWYNRRPIAGSTRWSQHAWANALDIGPLYGIDAQQGIYEYLINYEEDDMPTIEEIRAVVEEVVRVELDRLTTGEPGPVNAFYGIGGAVATAPIGRTNPDTGKAPPLPVGGYLQKTYVKVKKLDS